jgi:hypothetical protein
MKLYSRGQVTLFSIGAGILGILLALGFGLLPLPSPLGGEAQDIPVEAETHGFALQTTPIPPESVKEVATTAEYTEDETENIRIYEQLNQAVAT